MTDPVRYGDGLPEPLAVVHLEDGSTYAVAEWRGDFARVERGMDLKGHMGLGVILPSGSRYQPGQPVLVIPLEPVGQAPG